MRVRLLWSLMLSFVAACAATEPAPDIEKVSQPLSSSVEQEVQASFNDAACYCQAYLIDTANKLAPTYVGPGAIGVSADSCSGDPRLAKFVSQGGGATCKLSAQSPHGSKRDRVTEPGFSAETEHARNGCVNPTKLLTNNWSTDGQAGSSPTPGFCRADFNYCLAQQLRLTADSLARAPSSRESRDALLAEARLRFSMSANEHLTTLEWVDEQKTAASCTPQQCPKTDTTLTDYASTPFTGMALNETCHRECREAGDSRGEPPCWQICMPNYEPARAACANHAVTARQTLTTAGHQDITVEWKVTGTTVAGKTKATCGLTGTYKKTTYSPCKCERHNYEQTRVSGSYGSVVMARVADAVSQVADLATVEALSQVAQSDAIGPLSVSPEGYGDAVWGQTGPRMKAVTVLAGEGAVTEAASSYAHHLIRDNLALRAVALLEDQRVPVPFRICNGVPAGWSFSDEAGLAEAAATTFSRLAARTAQNQGAPIAQGVGLLRDVHAIDLDDVKAAVRLMRDRSQTMDVDFYAEPGEGLTPGPDGCVDSILRTGGLGISQRTPLAVLAAAGRAGTGYPQSAAKVTVGPKCGTNWYSGHEEQLRRTGAMGMVQTVRHRLARLKQDLNIKIDGKTWAQQPAVQRLETLTRELMGTVWTEYAPYQDFGRWLLIGDSGFAPERDSLHLVTSEEDLYCLLHKHAKGGLPNSTCQAASEGYTAVTTTAYGLPAVGFDLVFPWLVQGPETRKFVVYRTCQDATRTTCSHVLLDVLYPGQKDASGQAQGQVHAFGGKLGGLVAKVLAKNPNNPADPLFTAIALSGEQGLATRADRRLAERLTRDFVPPVGHPLLGTSDPYGGGPMDDGYEGYLAEARMAAEQAGAALEEARQLEVSWLQFRQQVTNSQDSATNAQLQVMSDACGNSNPNGTCALAREPVKTLGELGIVPSPGQEPRVDGKLCSQFMSTFKFQVPGTERGKYVKEQLGGLLKCTRYTTLLLTSSTPLFDVPTVVIDELRNSGSGQFTGHAGEVKQQLIRLFQSLTDMQQALRKFNVLSETALVQLEIAASKITDQEPSTSFMCRFGKIVGAVATMVAAGIVIYATGGAALGLAGSGTAAGWAGLAGASKTMQILEAGKALISFAGGVENLSSANSCGDPGEANRLTQAAYVGALEATEQMRALLDQSINLAGSAASVDGSLDDIDARVELAKLRHAIELAGASLGAQGDPAWRAMQGKRVREARGKLLQAQRYAFLALRALEYRMADELRWLDADLEGRLFLADVHTEFKDGTRISDAADELLAAIGDVRTFAYGYAFANPAKRGNNDKRVLRLSKILHGGHETRDMYQYLYFKCLDGAEPTLGGLPAGALPGGIPCGSPANVEYAQAQFYLPATFTGHVAEQLGKDLGNHNSNYRIRRVGVNIDGSMRDCGAGDDDCFLDPILWYNLRQDGNVVLESLEGDFRLFHVTPGVVSTAEALQADVDGNDPFAKQQIEPLMRSELSGRPLAGGYTLTILSEDFIDWTMLDDIQLVLDYEYWVKQN